MGWRAWVICAVCVTLALGIVIEVRAKQPIFISWLLADDPGDQTILHYWERYELEELSPTEMVDLGTMLFYRGYPKDAVRILESALDQDKELHEAWFRIGLVEHQQGNIRDARIAYKRSLKIFKGQGWCNFYLGLLEEQDGHGKTAMEYYRAAFRYAPTLADKEINPEMASSELSLGAWLLMAHDSAFKNALPMPFLHPKRVQKIKSSFAKKKDQAKKTKKVKQDEVVENMAADTENKGKTKGQQGGGTAKLVPVTRSAKTAEPTSRIKPKKQVPRKASSKTPVTKTPGPKTPTVDSPKPSTSSENETPWGMPGTRNVSSDAYPGF